MNVINEYTPYSVKFVITFQLLHQRSVNAITEAGREQNHTSYLIKVASFNLLILNPEDVPDNLETVRTYAHSCIFADANAHTLTEQCCQLGSIFRPLFVAQRYIKFISAALHKKTLGQHQTDGD